MRPYSTPSWRFNLALVIATLSVQPRGNWRAAAWRFCPGGGVCPENNTCCPTSNGKSSCITAKNAPEHNGTSSCCFDDGRGLTGCGPAYRCASSIDPSDGSNQFFCELTDQSGIVGEVPEPKKLPRYQLCSVPNDALEQVHGLAIHKTQGGILRLSRQLAYYSTMHSLDSTSKDDLAQHAHARIALIMIHGSGRNADDYLCCATASLPKQLDPSLALVIAPRFLAVEDGHVNITGREWTEVLRWNETDPIPHTWRYGADAINSDISSYDGMDALLERLVFDKVRFPRLEQIIVAGHSAGGQFTQRWALTSCSPAWGDGPDVNEPRILPIRVVVANPRSFCYLDGRRYINGSLVTPDKSEIESCPGYNEWEWGLDSGGRLPTPYKDRALAKMGGPKRMKDRYRGRDIVYLAGALDVEHVHGSCEDDGFQGSTRRERSKCFFSSLNEIYGRKVHRRLVVPGVPHDHCLMFQSKAGYSALFRQHVSDKELQTA